MPLNRVLVCPILNLKRFRELEFSVSVFDLGGAFRLIRETMAYEALSQMIL